MESTTTNLWKKIKLYCLNHDEPLEMHIISNTEVIKTPFYACKNYASEVKDKTITPCSNRLNLDNYQEIMLELIEYITENGFIGDYTNYSFTYKKHKQNIFVKVIKWSDSEIMVGIRNIGVLGS